MNKSVKMLCAEKKIGKNLETYLSMRYSEEWKSTSYLAEMLGVHRATVGRWLNKLGIELRSLEDYFLKRVKRRPPKGTLDYYYNHERKPVEEIAKERGVNKKTVYRWMDYNGLPRRKGSDIYLKEGLEKPKKEELAYLLSKMSQKDVASKYCVDSRTVRTWKQKALLHKPRKSRYDLQLERKKDLDNVIKITKKEPENLVCDDFIRAKQLNGRSYRGILDWYMTHYGYNFSRTKEHFLNEFYNSDSNPSRLYLESSL